MTTLIDKIFDRSMPGLQKSLDLNRKRFEAISSNVANVETPGYRATDVNFAGELEKAFNARRSSELRTTNSNHMDLASESATSHLVFDYSGRMRADGNNVDIDLQMAKMNAISGKYSRGTALVRKKLRMLRMAIIRARM